MVDLRGIKKNIQVNDEGETPWRDAHADDPDNLELLEKTKAGKESYLRWGRDTQRWVIYYLENPKRAQLEKDILEYDESLNSLPS